MRRVLFATFLNNIHIVEDVAFQRLQGNMSGIALTTIVNCLFNMFLTRYAYIKLIDYDLTHYHRYIQSTFYGDDNLICINDKIIDKFNMISFCRVMNDIGIKYTTADKTDMICEYYTVEQISYLKRSFMKRSNIYYACLDWNTIIEIPRWSESDPTNMKDQLNRFNCVLYECVNYGFDVYQDMFSKLVKYIQLAKIQGFVINVSDLLTYNYILRSMFPQYFSCELTKILDQKLGLLGEGGRDITEKFGSNCSSNSNDMNSYLITSNLQTNSAEITLKVSKNQIVRNLQTHECREIFDFEDFVAMSADVELENMDMNAGESVTRAQVTTTFDDTIPHLTDRGEIQEPVEMNPYLNLSLEAFIKREWYVGEYSWTSADLRTSLQPILNLPVAVIPYLKCKLQNIAYWAPDFDLIFKINGTPMHYGRIMFVVIPSGDILADAYKVPQNASQHRFVQISPTGNQSVVMKVPWIHYYDRVPVSDSISSTIPWQLFAWIAAPLTSANSDKVAPVTVSIYMRITNPRFTGYTHERLVAQSAEQVILSTREDVTSGITQTGIVPFANTIARDVNNLAGDMSQLATDIGFGVSPNLTSTKPVMQRYVNLNRAEDLPLSVMLGPSQNQQVMKSDKYANSIKNEMYLAKVAGKMTLIRTLQVTSTTAVSDTLMQLTMTPLAFNYKDYSPALAPPVNCMFMHPAGFLTRLHRMWRGSIKLHFSIICSAFHSMRLRFSFSPYVSEVVTQPNAGTAAYNVNEVWDINNQTDYSVRIPFLQWREWALTATNTGWNIGTVYLTAMTKLSSTLETPNPIYIQVWAGMDDDFQLAYPYIPSVTTTLATVDGEVFKMANPDIGTWPPPKIEDVPSVPLVAQSSEQQILSSGNPMLNYRAMQFPSMSRDGLDKIVYPTLGGITEKHKTFRLNTSYEISSVKELVNMLTPMERQIIVTGAPTTVNTFSNFGRKFAPFGWMDRNAKDTIWFNFLYQMMSLFRYVKGSVRLVAISDRAVAATANMGDIQSSWSGSFWQEYDTDVFFDQGSLSEITTGSHLFSNLVSQPADVMLPYYSGAKCLPQTYGKVPYPVISYAPTYTDVSLLLRIPVPKDTPADTEIAKIVWLCSGGDDLQLGYQLPVPRCRFDAPPKGN